MSKGNKTFTLTKKPHAGGRPRKYTELEILTKNIEKYFKSLKSKDGLSDQPPTMAGLAIALGFESRQSLADYGKNEKFSYIIKKAKTAIELFWESRLVSTSPTGAIFWLKNHAEYADRQEVTGANGGPLRFASLTDEELDKLIAEEITRRANGK